MIRTRALRPGSVGPPTANGHPVRQTGVHRGPAARRHPLQPSQGPRPPQARPSPGWNLHPLESAFLTARLGGLTERERQVLTAICRCGTNEDAAASLCIALPTLRTHLMRLNQKLGTTSKGDLLRLVASTLLEGYRGGRIPLEEGGGAGPPPRPHGAQPPG